MASASVSPLHIKPGPASRAATTDERRGQVLPSRVVGFFWPPVSDREQMTKKVNEAINVKAGCVSAS